MPLQLVWAGVCQEQFDRCASISVSSRLRFGNNYAPPARYSLSLIIVRLAGFDTTMSYQWAVLPDMMRCCLWQTRRAECRWLDEGASQHSSPRYPTPDSQGRYLPPRLPSPQGQQHPQHPQRQCLPSKRRLSLCSVRQCIYRLYRSHLNLQCPCCMSMSPPAALVSQVGSPQTRVLETTLVCFVVLSFPVFLLCIISTCSQLVHQPISESCGAGLP